ncbi:uncharacterized protein LOC122132807 isoform X2 [Clupea harengus]|uniref:Uncharacterized protein LOC122132807 isoform X2 n=1 Tax=Clupea harengus TaxID=7950 RepID=A0A8M1KLC5_CLUHA|nr:uncharacterized protein LOC122132807 isoform X2 [Clupea harengus]
MANREEMHVTESNLTMAPDVMYYNMSLTTGDMELVRLQVDCEVEGANALFEATSEVKIAGPRDLLDESQSEAQHQVDDDRLCEKTEVKEPSYTTRLQELSTPSNDVWWSWYQNKYGPTYDDFRSLYILSDESDDLTHDADDEEDKINWNPMPLEDLKNDYDDMYFPGPCERRD